MGCVRTRCTLHLLQGGVGGGGGFVCDEVQELQAVIERQAREIHILRRDVRIAQVLASTLSDWLDQPLEDADEDLAGAGI